MKFLFVKVAGKTLLFMCLSIPNFAQTISVSGNISIGEAIGVKNALITFIDESDRSIRWTTYSDSLGNYQLNIITSVEVNIPKLPKNIALEQNYPNPFSRETVISYKVTKPENVSIIIYDILGQKVKSFEMGFQNSGRHHLNWDGQNNFGKLVSNGIYFYQLHTEKESIIKKMLIMDNGRFSGFKSQNFYNSNSVLKKDEIIIRETTYTAEIRNSENTKPWIKRKEVGNINIEQNTEVNVGVKEEILEKYYLYIGNRFGYILIYDTEIHGIVDSIEGFESELWDIETISSGKKLYVCTRDGIFNSNGSVYAVDLETKQNEVVLSKSAEIFSAPDKTLFIVASEPFDTLRQLGIIDTITNNIAWIDTIDIYEPGISNQGLIFDRNKPNFYSLTNNNKLFKYNYDSNEVIRKYESIRNPFMHMSIDKSGKYIYFAGGPAVDIENDSIVGDFGYAANGHNGSIVLSSDERFVCTTDPGGYVQLEPVPTGKIAVFYDLPQGFRSNNNIFIDVISATPPNNGWATDKILLTDDNTTAFVSNWITLFFVLDLKDNIVSDIIEINRSGFQIGPILLIPKVKSKKM